MRDFVLSGTFSGMHRAALAAFVLALGCHMPEYDAFLEQQEKFASNSGDSSGDPPNTTGGTPPTSSGGIGRDGADGSGRGAARLRRQRPTLAQRHTWACRDQRLNVCFSAASGSVDGNQYASLRSGRKYLSRSF